MRMGSEERFRFKFGYQMKGHTVLGAIDMDFYRELPGIETEYLNPVSLMPETPNPDLEQELLVIGTTWITPKTLCIIIKNWLKERRTRICISAEGSISAKIEFEGPSIKDGVDGIRSMLETFAAKEDTKYFEISALLLDAHDK